MSIYQENQKRYYSTRSETLKVFRDEQKQKCNCKEEVWGGKKNKLTCLNSIRKEGLESELKNKGF